MTELIPFFSIIIPTFNRADLLPKAIESVLAQTFTSWELIVVDDGSTDNTADVIKAYKDDRIRYIYQTNAERSAARNNGINHARADYICFLDSDDYYLPDRLKQLHALVKHHPTQVAMFYTDYVMEKNGEIFPSGATYLTSSNLFQNIFLNVIHSQQTCISNKILQEFKYDPGFRIGEDMELWLRIARKYPVVYFENQATVVVVNHEDRSVNIKKYNPGEEQLKLFKLLFSNAHSGKYIPADLKPVLISRSYQDIAKYHIHQGNRLKAILAIAKAINLNKRSAFLKFRINIFLHLVLFSSREKIIKLVDY